MIGLVYAAQGHRPPEGAALQLDLKVWTYALEAIPTHHLEECFRRALSAKRSDFPMTSAAVNREWDALVEELRTQADEHALRNVFQLMPGEQRMYIGEWKARHNLPEAWSLGDPIPPESDLFGVEPGRGGPPRLVFCRLCDDAHWVVDRSTYQHPRLVLCKCRAVEVEE